MQKNTVQTVSPSVLKKWIHDDAEIALLDVREHGEYGEAHLFYVVSTPFSKLESEVDRMVQRKNVRIVLVDETGGELADLSAQRLRARGYTSIWKLDGGIQGWKNAGYVLFAGVNLPSKAFGELAEHAFNTPRITALELNQRIGRGDDIIVLDGRPFTEFKKMSIPTAICCPNGELPLRIEELVPSAETTIVINCAGRTRSIIGAQTLINLGVKNKVIALENGTQGWFLADLKLDHGKTKRHAIEINIAELEKQQLRAHNLAKKHGVTFVNHATVMQWLAESDRTTFLCDVRTPEEFATGSLAGAQNTPGGQLVQTTDQFVAVKGARIVVFDSEGVRAPAMASWLAMMNWEVAVLENALSNKDSVQEVLAQQPENTIEKISSQDLVQTIANKDCLLDLRASMQYRQAHIVQAMWATRARLHDWLHTYLSKHALEKIVLLSDDIVQANLFAQDLRAEGIKNIYLNTDTATQWKTAGLDVIATPSLPADEDCIDYLFFVHDRHDGNKVAARKYLEWEINLLNQIDEQERNSYKFPH